MLKYCYCTLADTPFFLKEVFALIQSLIKVNSQYPLIVMIPEKTIAEEELNNFSSAIKQCDLNIKIIKIPFLLFNQRLNYCYNSTINKFWSFALLDYDKILFIDADMIITKNIDNIFELEGFSVFVHNINNQKTISGNIFIFSPNYKLFTLCINNIFINTFYNDENVLTYLWQTKQLHFSFIENKFNNYFFHDGGAPKTWIFKNYEEIRNIFIQNQELNTILSTEKNKINKTELETLYLFNYQNES